MLPKLKEKKDKFFLYIKLHKMFRSENEFNRTHTSETVKLWEKKFGQMIRYSSNRTFSIVEEFLSVKIEKIKESNRNEKNNEVPIIICAVKNDIDKIKLFMIHYRKLGIRKFVFLDNMSTDGTYEYLLNQNDATIFRCNHPFTADRKIAWMNRMIAEEGIGQWYLMVDSDEFVTYIGAEKRGLEDVIKKCKEKGYKRLGSVMLDMYPNKKLFELSKEENVIESYCYLDKDTYIKTKASNGIKIVGGPRNRVFGTRMKLSKYCLFYFEEDDIIPSAHFLIPFEKGFGVPVAAAILHYKFVNENDYQKVIEAVKTGMHSDNSAEYKTYLEGIDPDKGVTFYSDEHSMLFTVENLQKISILDTVFED